MNRDEFIVFIATATIAVVFITISIGLVLSRAQGLKQNDMIIRQNLEISFLKQENEALREILEYETTN